MIYDTVLLTGAHGRMGTVIRPALGQAARRVRLTGRQETPGDLAPNEEYVAADLSDSAQAHEAVAGADAIVHLAGIPDEAPFEALLTHNIHATYNVYEAARVSKTRRVVFASTNHVVGFYPTDQRIGPLEPPRPDTLYGASKVFGEALARLYYDKWGVESVCLRIGSFRDRPSDRRQLSTWLSHRDGIELVLSALSAESVGCTVVFGVSANASSWWADGAAEPPLSFRALDDAQRFAGDLAGLPQPGPCQGGAFTAADYEGGLG
jgi:uronate dehydrogenase